ncbi:MAG: SsrA-binding protein SmpB [bacterium]|nr:SsrA-binding protein SmpB [bacterium]
MTEEISKIFAQNKKAFHDFHITQRWEAGIALLGSEVKSVRAGRVQLRDAYARFLRNELWLVGVHISPYDHGAYANHNPTRPRKLLLHRAELRKMQRQVEEKGATLVPLSIYLKNNRVKVELGLALGKKKADKRVSIQERENKRELERTLKQIRTGKTT